MSEPEFKNVGTFEIETGVVRVTDPCYDRNVWCSGSLDDVKLGRWNAFTFTSDEGSWGKRIKELHVAHVDHRDNTEPWTKAEFEVGVDSGQAGVFDDKYYRDDNIVKDCKYMRPGDIICEDEPWYSFCCDRTCDEFKAGVIPFGAVSSSGFGDGGYSAYYQEDKDGKIDAIKIVFISESQENDECDESEDETEL